MWRHLRFIRLDPSWAFDMGWQDFVVAGIVTLALVLLLRGARRSKMRGDCGHDCGCGKRGKPND